jgi:MFS family permease
MADMTARLARPGFALLFTLSMAQFMVVLDFTIVNVALPSIQHGLHVATTTLQWLVSAYAVAFGGFLLLGGRLADAYGRARLYRIGLVTFVVASALALGMTMSLLALAGAAVSALVGALPALLAALFVVGVANRLSQVASTLAGTHGPVAARSEGTASALLTATRQCGSALGVAIVSATLVAMGGSITHRTAVAMFVTAGFALAGLLATRVVPAGPPLPQTPQPHHLFRHRAGGLP